MDSISSLNQVVAYIEGHLSEPIDNAQLARIAGCSQYHLLRMFPFVAGVSLSEYIRRRRLTTAGFDLQQGKGRVIDIAQKYGYDSPTAFTRAFRALHGIAPSTAQGKGALLKAYPVLSFHLSVKGETQMQYKIVEKEAFAVTGIKQRMALVDGDEDFQAINRMWSELTEAQAQSILANGNGEIPGLLGLSAHSDGVHFDYYIACTTEGEEGENFLPIPAGIWGVFTSTGPLPDALVNTWQRIFTDWFPGSGYEFAEGPTLEIYGEGDSGREDYQCELWLPLSAHLENR